MRAASSEANWPGWIARDSRIARHADDYVTAQSNKRAVADLDAIDDAAAAADVTVAPEPNMTSNGDVRSDQGPVTNDDVVVNDGIRQDAHVVGDDRIAGDHDAGHDQHIAADTRQGRNPRRRVYHRGEPICGETKAFHDRRALAEGHRATWNRKDLRRGVVLQRLARQHWMPEHRGALFVRSVVDKTNHPVAFA